jgi:hypothetical protein
MNPEKEYKLLHLAEKLIILGKYDLVFDILDEVFESSIHVYAWILTESNPEYSIYSKSLFEQVQKYNNIMYNPFRNFDWTNK